MLDAYSTILHFGVMIIKIENSWNVFKYCAAAKCDLMVVF